MPNQFTTSIWGDEGFSAILSMKTVPEIIAIIIKDTSPPLWNLTEYLAFQTFGTSEIVIRGLAFLYFSLTIFFVYKIGELIWNRKTGLLAATLTFLNPFFFIYAFEGRMYSIMALGVAASMYFFLKILKSKNSNALNLVGYVIGTLWALYSHHFAIFVVFIQGLWFIYEFAFGKRKTAITIFKGFLFVGLGYLPWIYPLYLQTKMVGGGFWLGTPTLEDLRNIIYEYLAEGNRNLNLSFPKINLTYHKMALYLVLVIALLRRWDKNIKETLILLSWFLGPIVLTWLISQKFQSIFFNRYLLYTIPAAMIILASNGRKYSGIFIGILLLIFLQIDWHYFTHPTKLPFKELSIYVQSEKQEGDYLINWNSSGHHLWETKYYNFPAPIYIPDGGELPYFVGTALMGEEDIIYQIPEDAVRVGVVTSGPIEEIILPGYTEIESHNFNQLKFVWYQKEK